MKLTTSIILVLLIVCFMQTSNAATITVGAGGCTLRDAIRAANSDGSRGDCPAGSGLDTIVLSDSYSTVLSSDLPTITSPLVIETATPEGSAIIDGDNNHRIFFISGSDNVTLRNLTLTNARVGGIGGLGGAALYIVFSDVTLMNLNVTSNRVVSGTRRGAGLRAIDSNLVIENSVFSLNRVERTQTAKSRGGDMYLDGSTATINNTTFQGYPFQDAAFNFLHNNGASEGSAIYAADSSVEITNSTFINQTGDNNSTRSGMSLFLTNGSSANISNSTFTTNRSSDGYYYNGKDRIYVEDSELHLNHATIFKPLGDYGLVTNNAEVSASNSLFTGSEHFTFCLNENDDGDSLPFVFTDNTNNVFPNEDQSCASHTNSEFFRLVDWPADNGGPTETAALRVTIQNPAINGGDPATCEPLDQRGFARGDDCDVGAFELSNVTDLAVDMTRVTSGPFYAGQNIEYLIEVSNNGPADAYDVDLVLTLSGLAILSAVTAQDCVNDRCSIDAIPNGGSVLITLNTQINGASSFNAEALVNNISGLATDPDIGNNIDDTGNGGSINPAADLRVSQVLVTPPPYANGQNLTFEVTVENDGPSNAAKVSLSHNLDSMTPVSYTGCSSSTPEICLIENLAGNANRVITYVATLTDIKVGAEAQVSSELFDPRPFNNTSATNIYAEQDADLKVSMNLINSSPYYIGQYLQFEISIVNGGPDTATNVLLESLDENLIISDGDTTCTILPCEVGNLSPGSELNVQLAGFLQRTGQFSHFVRAYSDQTDPDLNNNADSIMGVALPAADVQVSVELLGSAPYYADNIATFIVRILNDGAVAASDVEVSTNLENLEIVDVYSTHCTGFPCTIPSVEVSAANEEFIEVSARIKGVGQFKLSGNAVTDTYEELLANNSSNDLDTAVILFRNKSSIIFGTGFE